MAQREGGPDRVGYGTVLQHQSFRWLWQSVLFSRISEAIATIALPLLVYDVTGSSSKLGLILVIQLMPRVVLAPITGLLADRLDRRRLMAAAALLRMASVLLIPLGGSLTQIGALAVVFSIGTVLAMPAELAALPPTVPRQQLVTALSLVQVTNSTMRVIGPAAGAALVGFSGTKTAFWLVALCLVATLICLRRLDLPVEAERSQTGPLLARAHHDIVDGLKTVFHTPIVRGVTASESLFQIISMAIAIAGLVYLKEDLNLGDRSDFYYGILSASMSAGAVVGALIASRVERKLSRPVLLAAGYLGPLMVVPAILSPPAGALFACWFAFGFTDAWAVIAFQAYMAETIADDMRGRVYATWGGIITLAQLIASGAIGWVTGEIGAPRTLAICGALVGIGGPLLLFATGAIRAVRALHQHENETVTATIATATAQTGGDR